LLAKALISQTREQIIKFLDTKIKTIEEDPDARWITTWNHYLSHIKYFFRWLYNAYHKKTPESFSAVNGSYNYCLSSYYDWQTPSFIQIRKKKTKRTSPYLETELWLLFVIQQQHLFCNVHLRNVCKNDKDMALCQSNVYNDIL
jgi:hypothetical protein